MDPRAKERPVRLRFAMSSIVLYHHVFGLTGLEEHVPRAAEEME